MSGVLKTEHSRSFKEAQPAFEYLMGAKYKTVFLYNSQLKKLRVEVDRLFDLIREHNGTISNMDDQFIATNGYYFDDIDGCLAVKCCEISIDRVADSLGTVALITGFNKSVLVDTTAKKADDVPIGVPGKKAMTSFAMLGYLMHNN